MKAVFRTVPMLCTLLILLIPAPAQESPAGPNGHSLLRHPAGELQAYVSGIYEGQALLAAALRVPQIVCVDATMNRRELALTVLDGISRLPEKDVRLHVRLVVFRALIEKLPCPGFKWEE